MATKICADEHCEATFEAKGARKFCDLHAGVKKPAKAKKPKTKPEYEPEPELMVVSIDVTMSELDRIWSAATIEEKAIGIQALLEYSRA